MSLTPVSMSWSAERDTRPRWFRSGRSKCWAAAQDEASEGPRHCAAEPRRVARTQDCSPSVLGKSPARRHTGWSGGGWLLLLLLLLFRGQARWIDCTAAHLALARLYTTVHLANQTRPWLVGRKRGRGAAWHACADHGVVVWDFVARAGSLVWGAPEEKKARHALRETRTGGKIRVEVVWRAGKELTQKGARSCMFPGY